MIRLSGWAGALALLAAATAAPADVADHLKCYKVKDPQATAKYTADLGGLVAEPGCTIKVPAIMACVPSTKTNVSPTPPGEGGSGTPNAFGCYKIKCAAASLPAFQLNDQFGSRSVTPTAPKLLCAPVAAPTTTTTLPPCSGIGDCPTGTACNLTTGQCESACGDANHSGCQSSCCGGGTCQTAETTTACGNTGGACAVCDAANPSGSACVGGHCGCNSTADCPAASGDTPGRACLLAGISVCVSQCNAPNVGTCNGGCCSAAPNPQGGTCQPGTADTACGNTGGTCTDCTSTSTTCMNGTCM